MATSISVYDLQNYPNSAKTVTLDLKKVTPYGAYGDEKWVLNTTTTATASGSAVVQPTFVDHILVGWCKSNAIVTEPFTIDATHCNIIVAIDEPIGSGETITLTTSALAISGDSVAADLESKLVALTITGAAKDGNLSYLNAKCYYENGRFIILSGSLSDTFTGSGRSSVAVTVGATNDVANTLGFDINYGSEELAGQSKVNSYVTAPVVASTTVNASSGTGLAIGDCVAFKTLDGTIYYRYLDNVAGAVLTVNAVVTLDTGDLIQLLRIADPNGSPATYYTRVDDLMRHSIDLLVRQINFA